MIVKAAATATVALIACAALSLASTDGIAQAKSPGGDRMAQVICFPIF
jgi:hypothetical protein